MRGENKGWKWLAAGICAMGMAGAASAAERIAVMPIDAAYDMADQSGGKRGPEIVADLVGELVLADERRAFEFLPAVEVGAAGEKVSALDVKGYCRREMLPYGLYGHCSFDERTIELAMALYERDTDRVVRTYYAKGEKGEWASIVKEMAGKIVASLYVSLEIDPVARRYPARLVVKWAGGWWYPMYWGSGMISCFSADAGAGFQTAKRLPVGDQLSAAVEAGMTIRYQLAVSTPEVEPYTCHFVRMGLPVDFRFSTKSDVGFSLSLKPFYDLGIATVQRRYGSSEAVTGGAPGCGLSTSFDLYLGKRQQLRIGVVCGFDVIGYKDYSLQPSVGLDFDLLVKEF